MAGGGDGKRIDEVHGYVEDTVPSETPPRTPAPTGSGFPDREHDQAETVREPDGARQSGARTLDNSRWKSGVASSRGR
jgi:hypothetical protein